MNTMKEVVKQLSDEYRSVEEESVPAPQLAQKPLTDEEAIELINTTKSGINGLAVAIVRAVEAAHNIKETK